MEHANCGCWRLNLNGICYREVSQLGKLLVELGDGSYPQIDLETLEAKFDAHRGEVFLTWVDEKGNHKEL